MKRLTQAIKEWLEGRQHSSPSDTHAGMSEIEELRSRIRSLAKTIDAPGDFVPKTNGADFGWAQLEYDGTYRYFYVERGEPYDIRVTDDLDEILFWVFSDISWGLASNYELIHRDTGSRDIRRLLFSHQLNLLNKIKPEWGDRRRMEINKILAANPFKNV